MGCYLGNFYPLAFSSCLNTRWYSQKQDRVGNPSPFAVERARVDSAPCFLLLLAYWYSQKQDRVGNPPPVAVERARFDSADQGRYQYRYLLMSRANRRLNSIWYSFIYMPVVFTVHALIQSYGKFISYANRKAIQVATAMVPCTW